MLTQHGYGGRAGSTLHCLSIFRMKEMAAHRHDQISALKNGAFCSLKNEVFENALLTRGGPVFSGS